FQKQLTLPTLSLYDNDVTNTPQASSIISSSSINKISNELNNEPNDRANYNDSQPQIIQEPILAIPTFFEDDKKNSNSICKICIKQLEGTYTQPYPYTKSSSSTGHFIYHFREKHNITTNNYKVHLDSYQK
ncbi:38842_t:CDS:2, partial [Gigaspora margarita]